MRKLLLGLAVLVVLLIAAVLVLPGFLDWNQYKGQLTAAAREATGRSVVIDGDISLRLLPAPALSAAGVRIGNIDGGSTADMVRLTALDVRVALVPLLSGRIEVRSVRLVEPVAVFEVLADGRANWDLGAAPPAPGGPAATAAPAPAATAAAADEPLRLTLDRFEIVDGEVIYRDARSGIEERITGLNISGSAASLQGPFAVAGELQARDLPLRLDLSLGRIAEGRAVPLRLTAELADELDLDLKGRVEGLPTAARISGVLRVESPDLVRAAARGGIELPSLLAQPVKLDTRIAASADELAFNDIVFDLGGANASGALNLGLADGLTFDAALAVGRLDLDAMLAARAEAEQTGTVSPVPDSDGDAADGAGDGPGAIVIPQNVAGNLTLNVDGIAYQGSVIRQAQLALTMLDGRLEVTRAAALLPGGSDVSLTGQAVNADGGARFDGRLAFASDSLRSLLTWLGIDVAAVPAARLTSFSITTNVAATASLIQLSDANLRLDTIAGTAAAAYRLQRRPSFGVSLSLDRVNLDAYLPPPADTVPEPRDAAAGGTAQTQAESGGGGLALLDAFDANLLLNIARLSARGVDLNGVAVNASLVGGMLDMKKLQVADLAGGTLSLTGSARGFAAEPEIDASLQYQAATVAGLTRLIGIDTGASVERLSDLALATTLRGTSSALALRGQISLAGGQGTINGTLADPQSTPKLALDFKLEHPSLAELFAALALEQAPLDADDLPVKLAGAVEGEAGDLQATMELGVAAARLSASGKLDPFREEPTLDVAVRLAGDDINRSLAALGVAYRPAVKVPGGYALDVRLAGDTRELALEGFAARFGPIELNGSGMARFDGARPYVRAAFEAGDVNLDLLRPRQRGGATAAPGAPGGPPPVAPGGERWSREPIDLAALQAVDADLELRAAGLVFDRYPFVEPRLSLSLRDGTMTLTELAGRLFDGEVAMRGALASRPVPAVELNVRLDGADLEQALRTAFGFSQVSGRVAFEGDFRARGASERGLVRSLNGNAAMSASDGVIRGFDMQGFSDRLGELNRSGDYVDLLARSFSGGETALTRAAGTWQIENGVARTEDTKAELEASQGSMAGQIDLANWRMDLRALLRLTEHADAPALGMDISGPLDAPRRELRTAALEQYLIGRFGQELLRKGLGEGKVKEVDKILELLTRPDGSGGEQGQPGSEQPAAPSREEVLDSLLKGLLKR